MAVKNILKEPDKILRQVSLSVEKVGKEEQSLMDDMLETMYEAKGIGLAAIQIGVPKRIIVMDISNKDNEKKPMYFVNPLIKNKNSNFSTYEEGCLSIPETFIEIERPKICEIEYIDSNGFKKELKCDGLMSTCVQHEINHLDGKLIIDHLSKLKKDFIIKKISKIQKSPDRVIV